MSATPIDNGLHGYLSATLSSPPAGYGYGVSFYSTVWALLQDPLQSFQIGLPSTWIIPENSSFTQALCPPGTHARDNADKEVHDNLPLDWATWAPTFRGVFQTIEGGMGFWTTSQFPMKAPKYRINGVPDCYTNQIGSPGWPFGGTSALPDAALGLAQLSNRLLVPPDGVPFAAGAETKRLGIAWMALPFTGYDGYFRLQTKQSETENKCLEGNRVAPTSDLHGASFMAPCGNFTGQTWKLVQHGDGYFYLETLQLEAENKALEGNQVAPGSDFGGAAFMAPRGDFTGQLWKLVPARDGYYHLQTMLSEKRNECFDGGRIAPGAPLGGAAHMAPISDSDSQLWKLVPVAVGNQIATGDSSWTLFLSSENFKGPVAFFPPTTWSRISKLNLPAVGRGLDAREGTMGSGTMEFAAVPGFESDSGGVTYSRIPKLLFPTETRDSKLITPLMQDVTMYSRQAVYAAVMSWFSNGPVATGAFDPAGAATAQFQSADPIQFDQGSAKVSLTGISDIVEVTDLSTSTSCSWGLLWKDPPSGFLKGQFPEYFQSNSSGRAAIKQADVLATDLATQTFAAPSGGQAYTSPLSGAWTSPGPVGGPTVVTLGDGTKVTYSWYKFIDQPALQNLHLTAAQKTQLQSRIELLHRNWKIDRNYIAAPSVGDLVSVDPKLIVTAPAGFDVGYVPIVTKQEHA
jgi:hypothetical protein